MEHNIVTTALGQMCVRCNLSWRGSGWPLMACNPCLGPSKPATAEPPEWKGRAHVWVFREPGVQSCNNCFVDVLSRGADLECAGRPSWKEPTIKPGWLADDVQRAADRVDEWHPKEIGHSPPPAAINTAKHPSEEITPDPIAEFNARRIAKREVSAEDREAYLDRLVREAIEGQRATERKGAPLARAMSLNLHHTISDLIRPWRGQR